MVEPEVFQDQVEVSTVGFEVEIEQVPDQWNAAGRRVEAEVGQHPEKFIVRYPKASRLIDDVETNCSAGDVADTGDQPDDGIRAEGEARSRHSKCGVHEPRPPTHPTKADQKVNLRAICAPVLFLVEPHTAAFNILLRRLMAFSSERFLSA